MPIPSSIMSSPDVDGVLESLPRVSNWDGFHLYKYGGFWFPNRSIKGLISFQKNFQARDTDIIVVTSPKSGTTWLKALTFAVVNRSRFKLNASHPLLSSSPHDLVRFLEYDVYARAENPDLETLPDPRIFATHAPYSLLPSSITESKCRIVYISRNPLDTAISKWHFTAALYPGEGKGISLDESLEMFCEGVDGFGPFWEHVLGFWNESLRRPEKVLFLKYEEMQEDIGKQVVKLGEFLGVGFSEEEKKRGVVEEIARLCSFGNLKSLEISSTGKQWWGAPNRLFFREGKVGDWENHLSPSMAERARRIMEEKFSGSGLTFQMTSTSSPSSEEEEKTLGQA